MTTTLALTGHQLAAVKAILDAHLPAATSASIFGSRAGGTPKPWSDLDLVLEGTSALPLSVLAAMAEAFDESALPWKVDIIDRAATSEAFARMIDKGPKVPVR